MHHLFVCEPAQPPSSVSESISPHVVGRSLAASRVAPMPVELEPDTRVHVCEIKRVRATLEIAHPEADRRLREPGTTQEAQHPTLEHRLRYPLDGKAAVQDLSHCTHTISAASSKRPVPTLDVTAPDDSIALGAVECLLDNRRRRNGPEVDQRPRRRRHRDHSDNRTVRAREQTSVMDENALPDVPDAHRNQHFDHVRKKPVEPVERRRSSVRSNAIHASVEDGGEHLLLPTASCANETEHRRRDSLRATALDEVSESASRQPGLIYIGSREKPQLSAG